jgi:hypothetical protein
LVERNVDYDLEMVDDLPDTNTNSPLEDQLRRIQYDPERHAPRWGRIGRYDGPSHAAAAGSAANVLRKRHGDTAEVEGWRFETRRIEEGTATGLFAQYNPDRVVPGRREENVERYEEFKQKQREAGQRRAEKKKAAAEAGAGA